MHIKYNLETIIKKVVKEFIEIDRVYLFGSRVLNPNLENSDIDLIFILTDHRDADFLLNYIDSLCPHIDSFIYKNGKLISLSNGLIERISYENLISKYNLKLLWSRFNGKTSELRNLKLSAC